MPWIHGCRRRWSRASRAARALRSASPICSPGIPPSPRPRSPRSTTCRTDAPCWASAPATAAPRMSACRNRARARAGSDVHQDAVEGRARDPSRSERASAVDQARAAGLSRRLPSAAAAGRRPDRHGVFANYGLAADNIRDSRMHIAAGAKAAGRASDDLEIWQIAALDCNEDRGAARNKVGAMLAFLAGYVIGDKHLETRGVPEPLRAPLLELRRRYSTRPGEADIRLVEELGLFDYLSRRLSICGNPQDCLAQALAAKAAGAERLMLTVSLASDPVRTVELFGEHVLPKL